jgi:hypothetical protein
MKVAVQTESLEPYKEAVLSDCEKMRFGPEFCDLKIPDLKTLRLAHKLAEDAGKEFAYVTPPISNPNLEKIRGSLSFLDKLGSIEVIVNDLGVLRLLKKYQHLEPHLGRLRVYIPGRCPWSQITRMPNISYFSRKRVEQIFYQTALNYEPTIKFYKEMGVQAADVDWIPQSFKHYKELVEHGVNLSVHTHLVPAALTRKCHTARLLGEGSLDSCSKPCHTGAYEMKNEALKVELFLQGNGVFRITEPTKKEADQLGKIGVSELVLTMRPVTGIQTAEDIQLTVDRLQS